MNFKVLTIATLLISSVSFSVGSIAEEMPESPRQKEVRIEQDINNLFKRAMGSAALKMDRNEDVRPFAIIKKLDGKLGVFELDQTPKNAKLSVMQMALSVRRYLTELAIAKQIDASVLVMYAVVKPKEGEMRQGLTFELEHIEGVSMMRFLPITDHRNDPNSIEKKLVLHTEEISDSLKPSTVFSDMVKALQANSK